MCERVLDFERPAARGDSRGRSDKPEKKEKEDTVWVEKMSRSTGKARARLPDSRLPFILLK